MYMYEGLLENTQILYFYGNVTRLLWDKYLIFDD